MRGFPEYLLLTKTKNFSIVVYANIERAYPKIISYRLSINIIIIKVITY